MKIFAVRNTYVLCLQYGKKTKLNGNFNYLSIFNNCITLNMYNTFAVPGLGKLEENFFIIFLIIFAIKRLSIHH